jgi:hypothetical protein
MVDADIVRRVIKYEQEEYQVCLSGLYGERLKQKAETEGLKGIAEYIREKRQDRQDGWQVTDMITREEYWRPARYADGTEKPPECKQESDHVPSNIRLEPDRENLKVVAECKFCKKVTWTPILLHWDGPVIPRR